MFNCYHVLCFMKRLGDKVSLLLVQYKGCVSSVIVLITLEMNVIEYFKPGEQMRMMYYSVDDTGKKSECSYQELNTFISIANMPHMTFHPWQYAGCLSHEPCLMALAPTSLL